MKGKRLWSFVLALMLVLSLIPAGRLVVRADEGSPESAAEVPAAENAVPAAAAEESALPSEEAEEAESLPDNTAVPPEEETAVPEEGGSDETDAAIVDGAGAGEGRADAILCADSISPNLRIGGKATINAEVRSGTSEEYELLENVKFYWQYDPNDVLVFDSAGNVVGGEVYTETSETDRSCEFTLLRKANRMTGSITLEARWLDEDGNERYEGRGFELSEVNYNIWLEGASNRLFKDGALFYSLHTEGLDGLTDGEDYKIELKIGQRGRNGWDILFTEGQEYNCDPATYWISLMGDQVFISDARAVDFYAGIWMKVEGSEDEWIGPVSECFDPHVELCETRIDYDREWDRSLLPGWDGTVNGKYRVYVENAENPDGKEYQYRVTDVAIIRDEPWDETKDSVFSDFHRDEDGDDYWWYYRAENHGEAVLGITYEDLEGNEQYYEITLNVGTDVYNVDLGTPDGVTRALPGETIDLFAMTRRDSEYDTSVDGVTYEWSILDDGSDFATLAEVPGEPYHVQVTFRDLEEEEDGIWKDIRVQAIAYDGQDEVTGEPVERGRRDIWLTLASDYAQIMPAFVEPGLDMGRSFTATWEVRSYPADNEAGYKVAENVDYFWFYDSNNVEILDARGNVIGNNDQEPYQGGPSEFTIRRLENGGTNIDLYVFWEDEYGSERREEIHYRLDDKNYNIWFEPDRMNLYDDFEQTAYLNIDELGQLDYELLYEVGWYDYHEDTDTGEWNAMLAEDEYEINGNEITISGGTIRGKGWGGVNIHARLFYAGEEIRDAWCWMELRENCGHHFWAKGVIQQAACEESGTMLEVCPWCGELRYTVIEPKGHSLKKVAAKAATVDAAGNIEHWQCTECKKLFADAAGTTEIAKKDTVVAKLIAQTITAKAAASSVAVGKTDAVTVTGAKTKVTYKSADTAIATISSKGVIKGVKVGTVKITVTAAAANGYAKASKTLTIKVVPAATSSLTFANTAKGVKVIWKKVAGATGYRVYRGSKEIKKITGGSTVSYTDTGAKTNGTKYTYKIVAFADTGKSTLSRSASTYFVLRPSISSLTSPKTTTALVKWGKNAKAAGYKIEYSLKKDFSSGVKTVSVTKAATVSATLKNLTKGKTYYVRICTYKTVSSRDYDSAWSAVKSVKVI